MNELTTLLVIGLVIGSNNLASSLAIGAMGHRPPTLRIVTIFGLFEFFVPLIGLWLGRQASASLASAADWLGPALIAGLGLYTLYCSNESEGAHDELAVKLARKRGLVLLAAGLSIDNLIVGFGVGLRGIAPLELAGTIAIFSMTFAAVGLRVGDRLQRHHRCRTEQVTGGLLLALAGALALGWI